MFRALLILVVLCCSCTDNKPPAHARLWVSGISLHSEPQNPGDKVKVQFALINTGTANAHDVQAQLRLAVVSGDPDLSRDSLPAPPIPVNTEVPAGQGWNPGGKNIMLTVELPAPKLESYKEGTAALFLFARITYKDDASDPVPHESIATQFHLFDDGLANWAIWKSGNSQR